jgi:hypothetical protein
MAEEPAGTATLEEAPAAAEPEAGVPVPETPETPEAPDDAALDKSIKAMLGLEDEAEEGTEETPEKPTEKPEITFEYNGKTYKSGDSVEVDRKKVILGENANEEQFRLILSAERQVAAAKSKADTLEVQLRKLQQQQVQPPVPVKAPEPVADDPYAQLRQDMASFNLLDPSGDPDYKSIVDNASPEIAQSMMKLATKMVGKLVMDYHAGQVAPFQQRMEQDFAPIAQQNQLAAHVREIATGLEQTYSAPEAPEHLQGVTANEAAEAYVAIMNHYRSGGVDFTAWPPEAQRAVVSQYLDRVHLPSAKVQPVPQAPLPAASGAPAPRIPTSPRTAAAVPRRPAARTVASDAELLGLS